MAKALVIWQIQATVSCKCEQGGWHICLPWVQRKVYWKNALREILWSSYTERKIKFVFAINHGWRADFIETNRWEDFGNLPWDPAVNLLASGGPTTILSLRLGYTQDALHPIILHCLVLALPSTTYYCTVADCESHDYILYNSVYIPQPLTFNTIPPSNTQPLHTSTSLQCHNFIFTNVG